MTLNLRIGRIGRLLAPNYSYCRRCETPWRFVKWHDTPYGSAGFGCFPLCEQCWAELTPIERLPFYRELIELWHPPSTRDESTFDDEWPLIYNAVLEGK